MNLLLAYLKLHIKSIVMFAIFSIIFCIVFALYSLPLEPVIYSVVLCIVFAAIIVGIGFIRFVSRHKALIDSVKQITIDLSVLPQPDTLIEYDYTMLINELYKYKCKIESEQAKKSSDMSEYYTLWAHQIKTPISAIRLLLQSSADTKRELDEQLFRVEQYVDMVLQYVRSESLNTDYLINKYPLDDIIKQVLRKFAKSFIMKKLKLEYSENFEKVITDEKWLTFVIEQLISNALKYTSTGSISIYTEHMNENKLLLCIKDTGIGIQAEDLPRIFDCGYTGFNGRTDKKSTGIGLYLCRKILTRLSHTLTVESQIGKGTLVKIGFDITEKTYE